MNDQIEIILPSGALGASINDTLIDTFLREFAEKNIEYEGQWAEKYGVNFENEKFLMHPYCWCEKPECPWCESEEEKEAAPNFWYKPLDFKVWWYKYIGRGTKTNKTLSMLDFIKMGKEAGIYAE